MKTSQDFNENFNQYSSEIEKEMSNLNRMLQEFASIASPVRSFTQSVTKRYGSQSNRLLQN